MMHIDRANGLILSIAATFLIPAAIPGVGLDYPYFFIMCLVLFAWFLIKWNRVRELSQKSKFLEVIFGVSLIIADYALNAAVRSKIGMIDLLIIFTGSIIAFYGLRSFKFFWVPATYGLILLLGYQIENNVPNYVALQDWLASTMASFMSVLGVNATVSGHLVAMQSGNSGPLVLDVASDCTGLQGILAFGMLSTMTLLDMKPKVSRLLPLFAIGFAGAFLINILRLFVVFLSFEYLGVEIGTTMHFYFGYVVFIAWVLLFWSLAFRYLLPKQPRISPIMPLPPKTQGTN